MQKSTVVLLESAENARRFYGAALNSQGYDVVNAMTPESLDNLIQGLAPKALILDMKSAGKSAFELCGQLHSQFVNLPIILLAERDTPIEPAEHRWAINRGASAIVRRHPSAIEELIVRVNELAQGFSSIDRPALTQAIQALRPASAPPIVEPEATIPPQTKAEEPEAKSRLLGGLQQAWNNLQTKAPAQSQDDPNEIVIRYRGTVVRRIKAVPVPEAELTRLATEAGVRETPPDTNEVQMRYRGSLVRRNTPESEQSVSVDNPEPEPEPTPTVATQVDVNNLLEDEDKPDDNDQRLRLRPRDERNNLSLRSGRV